MKDALALGRKKKIQGKTLNKKRNLEEHIIVSAGKKINYSLKYAKQLYLTKTNKRSR
jgi:hypothetical protein